MKKFAFVLLVAAMVVMSFSVWAAEDNKVLPDKVVDVRYKKCAVMGGDVKDDVVLLKDGKVYHFCCPGCKSGFTKDFEGSLKKIVDPAEVALKITNADGKCPVSGKPAVSDVFSLKGDSITFYCCKNCPEKDKSGKPTTGKIEGGMDHPSAPEPAVEKKDDHSGHNH